MGICNIKDACGTIHENWLSYTLTQAGDLMKHVVFLQFANSRWSFLLNFLCVSIESECVVYCQSKVFEMIRSFYED